METPVRTKRVGESGSSDRREYPQGTDLIFISTTGRSAVRTKLLLFACYALGLSGTTSDEFSRRSPPSLTCRSRFIFNPDAPPFDGHFRCCSRSSERYVVDCTATMELPSDGVRLDTPFVRSRAIRRNCDTRIYDNAFVTFSRQLVAVFFARIMKLYALQRPQQILFYYPRPFRQQCNSFIFSSETFYALSSHYFISASLPDALATRLHASQENNSHAFDSLDSVAPSAVYDASRNSFCRCV